MKIDWHELERGFEKEAFLRDVYKGVKDWTVGGLEGMSRGVADAAGSVAGAIPGVQQLQDMGKFNSYIGNGGLMKDLGGAAVAGLPLLMGLGSVGKRSSGTPNINIDLGSPKNILGSAPGMVRSLSSPKMAELMKTAGLGSALLKGLGAVKNVAKPLAKPLANPGALNLGKSVAAPAAPLATAGNMAKPLANPGALNLGNSMAGHSMQNMAHLERADLRQAIQNARVYGKTPAQISPIQDILKRRNLRMQQMQPSVQPAPGLGAKAANLIDPATLRTVVLSRMTNDVITGLEKNKAQQSSPRMLELMSKYPEMQQMLANPSTRAYFEKLLTKESQQHTDEKNIHPGS